MKNILTFIIPVRHQDNASDWRIIKRNLTDTVRSIANQDCSGWKAIIVANYGADLPDLPDGFDVKHVDFPPNPLYQKGAASIEDFYEAVRSDKGRRILAGMLHAGDMGHIMITDDDDYVSKRLTSFVATQPDSNGWYIRDGYVWGDGGSFLYHYDGDFSKLCGTSHIVRADLYNLPATLSAADEQYIRKMLGSHIFLSEHLKVTGSPLAPLPFIGAIYRTGHPENHSREKGIFKKYFFQKSLMKKPFEALQRISRLRIKNKFFEREFFGMS